MPPALLPSLSGPGLTRPPLALAIVGRPGSIPLPQQSASYSAKKRSALKTYLSLALPLAVCMTLYITNPARSLSGAYAQWDGDVSLQGFDGASCPVQVEPRNVGLDWNPLEDGAYRAVAAQRLIGAVQIVSSGQPASGARGGAGRRLTPRHGVIVRAWVFSLL